jgi:hypothetical protein
VVIKSKGKSFFHYGETVNKKNHNGNINMPQSGEIVEKDTPGSPLLLPEVL